MLEGAIVQAQACLRLALRVRVSTLQSSVRADR